jgi:hypothetical protein
VCVCSGPDRASLESIATGTMGGGVDAPLSGTVLLGRDDEVAHVVALVGSGDVRPVTIRDREASARHGSPWRWFGALARTSLMGGLRRGLRDARRQGCGGLQGGDRCRAWGNATYWTVGSVTVRQRPGGPVHRSRVDDVPTVVALREVRRRRAFAFFTTRRRWGRPRQLTDGSSERYGFCRCRAWSIPMEAAKEDS